MAAPPVALPAQLTCLLWQAMTPGALPLATAGVAWRAPLLYGSEQCRCCLEGTTPLWQRAVQVLPGGHHSFMAASSADVA
jgi:hypothetical protein